MSETALLDAQFPEVGAAIARANAEVSSAVAQVNASRKEFVEKVQVTVERAIILGQLLRKSWETFFAGSESGMIERARALRGDFIQQLWQTLELMRFALDQADRAALLVGEPLRGADSLAKDMAALESIQREALSRWEVSKDMVARLAAMADIPLQLDKHGDIYVGRSRVLLDTIIEHFKAGMPPEDIIRGYDTIQPADVYEAIAYYLRHKDDVEAYLQRRDLEAEALWQHIDASQPSKAERKDQIKERWSRRKVDHAAPAE
jgi:uncharacterized protein (DUF433 family)